MMLRIGTFSRRGRVSVKALRHYEAIGLLKPANVDSATGYRYYEPSQLDDLHRLMVLRALGLPLERIRVVLQDDPSPELMRHLLAERQATVARRIDAERAQLAAIEARIRPLEDAQPTYDIVLRDVPAALVASLRRVVSDYDAVESLLDEIARTLPKTARIAGHGAVWHHCASHKRQIDPSDEEAFAAACAAAWAAVADQPFELERGRCASATSRAPAIRASTSPKSSFRFVLPQEPTHDRRPLQPQDHAAAYGLFPDRRGHERQDRADRGPGRARHGGKPGRRERFRRPGRAGVQEPRCRRPCRGRHVPQHRENQQLLRGLGRSG